MEDKKNCYFYIHQYKNIGSSNVDLVMVLDDRDPILFQPMINGVADITALYRFTFALTDALEGGYSLFSCNSLRYGLRYITAQLPVKMPGFRLVFNHYDIAFALAVICKEDALLLPMPQANVFGTMDFLTWIKSIVTGRVGLELTSAWAEHLAYRFGLTPDGIALHGFNIMTVGQTYVHVMKEVKSYTPDQFVAISNHFRWMYAYTDEIKAIGEELESHETTEPYPLF